MTVHPHSLVPSTSGPVLPLDMTIWWVLTAASLIFTMVLVYGLKMFILQVTTETSRPDGEHAYLWPVVTGLVGMFGSGLGLMILVIPA